MKKGKRRIAIVIDMTPMVDIAFLLLIFYMATTQFKPPEKEHVSLPSSTSQFHLPNSDLINITVNKDDEIFRQTCMDILASETSRIGSKTNQDKVKEVIGELIDQHC